MRVLYISYNGLLDPLGQSQVLQYLVGLARLGHAITVLTFEKPDEWANEAHRINIQRVTSEAGLRWVPLSYHRHPGGLATLYDITIGLVVSIYLTIRHRIELVHSRAHIASVIANAIKTLFPVHFIFDPRGFWPDERVELGVWRKGSVMHRIAKSQESRYLRQADAVVTLTESAGVTMRASPSLAGKSQRFRVITTCTNLALFRPESSETGPRRASGPFTLGYLGTVGPPYLLDEVFALLMMARTIRPDARLLILNRRDHDYIRDRAKACKVPTDALELKAVTHDQVPRELWRVSAGVVFITPTPCRRSCAPTKLGEFLAAGVPCIANAGVGDLEKILEGEGVGVIVEDFSPGALEAGVSALISLAEKQTVRNECVDVANRYFSLDDGVKAYHALYTELAVAQ